MTSRWSQNCELNFLCHAIELSIMVPKWSKVVPKSMCHALPQAKSRALDPVSGLSQRLKLRVLSQSTVYTEKWTQQF